MRAHGHAIGASVRTGLRLTSGFWQNEPKWCRGLADRWTAPSRNAEIDGSRMSGYCTPSDPARQPSEAVSNSRGGRQRLRPTRSCPPSTCASRSNGPCKYGVDGEFMVGQVVEHLPTEGNLDRFGHVAWQAWRAHAGPPRAKPADTRRLRNGREWGGRTCHGCPRRAPPAGSRDCFPIF